MAWINNKMLTWDNKYSLVWMKYPTFKEVVSNIAKINGYSKQLPVWIS
jgi:hypothetical protein